MGSAFAASADSKRFYLDRMEGHVARGELRRDKKWDGQYGNAIECLLHKDDYEFGERELGIPQPLLRLLEHFFQNLPCDEKKWPVAVLRAIPVGADLSEVWPQWVSKALSRARFRAHVAHAGSGAYALVILTVLDAYRSGGDRTVLNNALVSQAESAAHDLTKAMKWHSKWTNPVLLHRLHVTEAAVEAIKAPLRTWSCAVDCSNQLAMAAGQYQKREIQEQAEDFLYVLANSPAPGPR